MRYFKSVVALGAVIGALAAAPSAQADDFATFVTNGNVRLVYTNGSPDSLSLATFSGTTANPVYTPASSVFANFFFKTANGLDDPDTPFRAIMTLSGSSSNPVAVGTTNTQDFNTFSIKFTNRDTITDKNSVSYAAGTANLLTLTATTGGGPAGLLSAQDGSPVPSFGGAQIDGAIIGYSSTFLDFTLSTQDRNYSLNINSAVNTANNQPGVTRTGTDFNNFTASFGGSFGATPIPLEPTPAPPGVVSGLIGIAMGGAQFGLMKFRRRRAKKIEATEVAA